MRSLHTSWSIQELVSVGHDRCEGGTWLDRTEAQVIAVGWSWLAFLYINFFHPNSIRRADVPRMSIPPFRRFPSFSLSILDFTIPRLRLALWSLLFGRAHLGQPAIFLFFSICNCPLFNPSLFEISGYPACIGATSSVRAYCVLSCTDRGARNRFYGALHFPWEISMTWPYPGLTSQLCHGLAGSQHSLYGNTSQCAYWRFVLFKTNC
jgi:hypothetical protein